MLEPAFQTFFEEQVQFRMGDGTGLDKSVFIGSTEFLPVEILRGDPDAYRAEFDLWLNEVWKPEQQQRREEILGLYANKKRYADLLDAVQRRQVVPFVGSGMSVASGLPTWADFLRSVRTYTKVEPPELEDLLACYRYEEAADLLASKTNARLFAERVEHDLRIDDVRRIAGAVRLLPAIFRGLVITTNLDNVLEKSYESCAIPFVHILSGTEIAQYRTLKSANSSFALKLHGDCKRTTGRVLLSSEYRKAYAKSSTVRNELALLYRTNNLLFMGCSLGPDRTVDLIREAASQDDSMPKHYCFSHRPADEAMRLEREIFLTQRGVYPIWYDLPHDECVTALLDGLHAP
jgi:hypothetical protein